LLLKELGLTILDFPYATRTDFDFQEPCAPGDDIGRFSVWTITLWS
jgi:hypothetical protein